MAERSADGKRMWVYAVDWKSEPRARADDDVDSFIRREGADAFHRLIDNAKPYGEWVIDQAADEIAAARDSYAIAKVVQRLLSIVKSEANPVVRARYKERIASIGGVSVEDVSRMVGDRVVPVKRGWMTL